MGIEFKLLGTDMTPPTYSRPGDAGIDLRVDLNFSPDRMFNLYPGDQHLFSTGIAIHIKDPNYVGLVFPRSGLGSKGLVLANTVGVIDSTYQGPIKLALKNTCKTQTIELLHDQRVAQLVILPIHMANLQQVTEFTDSSVRGESGFGSSGNS